MKKISLIIVLLSILLLSGCVNNEDNDPAIDDVIINELIGEEFNRISGLIPSTFSDDIILPSASDSFEVVYTVENTEVQSIHYERQIKDKKIVLNITITYEQLRINYGILITQLGDTNLFADELNRLASLIPNEFDDDVLLPESEDGFTVEYRVDGILAEDRIMRFELLPVNKGITLNIKVYFNDEFEETSIVLLQLGDEYEFNQYLKNLAFNNVFDVIDDAIPEIMVSNVTLPVFEEDNTDVVYLIDCTTIVRGRLVYTFPETSDSCELSALVTHDGEQQIRYFPITMSAFEELPRIPSLYITTTGNQPIVTKEEYIEGELSLMYGDGTFDDIINNAPMEIRLRGNSTLDMPKKAYRIKFEDPQRLLATYPEKSWVLLANHVDQTLIRNYLAFSLADRLEMAFTPSYTLVDVYVNGEYVGNYLLTDQVQVSENRVNVEEKVVAIDTGYLVELDIGLYREGLENTNDNYFLIDGIPFVIKSPDYEDDNYQEENKTYIHYYFANLLEVLKNGDDYSHLIDEASFIDWFIVNEIFKNVDSWYSSVYFHKDVGGLLKMGPVWDFDISSGVPGYIPEDQRGPYGWYTSRSDKNIFIYNLMQYPEFREHVKERWNEVYESSIIPMLDETLFAADSMTYSRFNNFEKWDIIGIDFSWYTSPEVYAIKTYDEQVWFLYDFLSERIKWMDEAINDFE